MELSGCVMTTLNTPSKGAYVFLIRPPSPGDVTIAIVNIFTTGDDGKFSFNIHPVYSKVYLLVSSVYSIGRILVKDFPYNPEYSMDTPDIRLNIV